MGESLFYDLCGLVRWTIGHKFVDVLHSQLSSYLASTMTSYTIRK